jgi:3',5'-nucleoside bisphosphate phosphatase
MRIDLHMHSTASDGAYSPSEVVQIALTNQMDVIALTDHDTLNGIGEAQLAAASTKVEVLAGVELSSEDKKGDRHVIGYLVDPGHTAFQQLLADLRGSRVERAQRIVEKLHALGLNVSLDRVYAIAGTGAVGRPHVAKAMLETKLVGSLQEAFDKYLADDGPAYVPHVTLGPKHAIEMIHAAGGVAVLAHPGRYPDYRPIVEELLPLGLDGVEAYYPDHSPEISQALRLLARERDLVFTVGSDFHRREGDGSARIGTVKFPADVDIVGSLKARAERYR